MEIDDLEYFIDLNKLTLDGFFAVLSVVSKEIKQRPYLLDKKLVEYRYDNDPYLIVQRIIIRDEILLYKILMTDFLKK